MQYDFEFGDGPFAAAVCLRACALGVVPKELSLIESKLLGLVVKAESFLVLVGNAIVRPSSDEDIIIADLRFLTCVAQLHEGVLRLSLSDVLSAVLVLMQFFEVVLVKNGGHLIDKGVAFCLGLEHYNKSQSRILQIYFRPQLGGKRRQLIIDDAIGGRKQWNGRAGRVDNDECQLSRRNIGKTILRGQAHSFQAGTLVLALPLDLWQLILIQIQIIRNIIPN